MALRMDAAGKKRWQNGIFIGLFLAVACFLFWKCQYGMANMDEGFHLAMPYRLYQGDALFTEEWHLAQMSAFLSLPPVGLYVTLRGSTEGLVLFIRCVCTAAQCLVALFLYFRLRRLSWAGAVCACLSFMLYIPYAIMSLSYNSMAYMSLVLCAALLIPDEKNRKSFYVLAGICYAAAVLCSPYLAAAFAVYLLAVGIKAIRGKKKPQPLSMWSVRGAGLITAGAAGVAAVFALFVFSRAALPDIVKAFTHIFNDPEHPSVSLLTQLRRYLADIFYATEDTAKVYPWLGLLLGVCLLDKKRKAHRLVYFAVAAVLTAVLMEIHRKIGYINHLMWSVNILGLFAAILSDDLRVRRVFRLFWLMGLPYSLCLYLASNLRYYAIAAAFAVAAVGSMMMIAAFAGELWRSRHPLWLRRLAAGVCVAVLGGQLAAQAVSRYKTVTFEGDTGIPRELITEGPQAGLYADPVWYNYYIRVLGYFEELETYGAEKVLFLTQHTWFYLMEDYETAGYSSWLAGMNEHSLNRLEAYYELNPEKWPELVYADLHHEQLAQAFADRFGYQAEYTAGGVVLTKE